MSRNPLRWTPAVLLLAACAAQAAPSVPPGRVAVFRDGWGVPHVYAATTEDAWFGLGHSIASDRLERVLFSILAARGELAQSLSARDIPVPMRPIAASVEQLVALDHRSRLWMLPEKGREAASRLDPEVRANYAAYVRGVEAYMAAHPERVPAWRPRDLTVADLVATAHSEVWQSYWAGIGLQDCQRSGAVPFVPTLPATDTSPATAAPPQSSGPAGASNGWVLLPSRTDTGGAILLSDPHGGIDGRFVYEYRLHTPMLESAGFAQGPLLVVARNANVGWAFTTGSPDVADCYRVRRTAKGANAYLYDGAERPIHTRRITIEVKGRTPVVVDAAWTDHNGVYSPVVAANDDEVWIVSTPYVEHLEGIHEATYRMSRARTVDELARALDVRGTLIQNVTAADRAGNAIFVHAGTAPRRPDPALDWTRAVPGNDSAHAWTGIHPASDLVTIRSPAAGYLQNNNVDPRFMFPERPPETLGRPEYLLTEGWIPPDRANDRTLRFAALLAAAGRVSADEARAFAMDTGVVHASQWVALVRASVAAGPRLRGDTARFARGLLRFDGRLDRTSSAALKYVYWREALRDVLVPEEGAALSAAILRGEPAPPELVAKARAAIVAATARLRAAPRGLARTYGDEFRLQAGARTVPMSGGMLGAGPNPDPKRWPDCAADELLCPVTLLAVGYGPRAANGERVAIVGTRMMRLDLFGPTGIRSYSYQNPGTSDDASSPNSSDQAVQLVGRQQLKPVRFEWNELRPEIVDALELDTRSGAATRIAIPD